MADNPAREQTTAEAVPLDQQGGRLDEPLPSNQDPGGAHTKGYSADPRPEAEAPADGPVPLAEVPEGESGVHQPEREGKVRPTGRSEPRDYTPNDRLMGSDR
jgi:hypothetical protein